MPAVSRFARRWRVPAGLQLRGRGRRALRQSIRMVVNAATLMSRMLLTFGIGLYVTRLLLDLVGASDFGLLTALGASGALLLLVTPALNEIGRAHV